MGQLLGNHGGRLKLAYLLGWIGPETYSECRAPDAGMLESRPGSVVFQAQINHAGAVE